MREAGDVTDMNDEELDHEIVAALTKLIELVEKRKATEDDPWVQTEPFQIPRECSRFRIKWPYGMPDTTPGVTVTTVVPAVTLLPGNTWKQDQ